MSIASEIERLQGVKADILQSIVNKGVEVPSGSMLDDCPNLIASISGGGSFEADNIVNIVPIDKMVVVDSNGYIGFDITNYFQTRGATYYYNYAILSTGDDFSSKGLGQVAFYTPASNNIGGRVYNTVIIGGKEWMAENLDFKFSGLAIGQSGTSDSEPRGNYYNNNETTYGETGKRYGLLYNWIAVNYLEQNKSSLIPGWHVPSIDEVTALITAVGGTGLAGLKLKSINDWGTPGDDTYGFSAPPAGNYYGQSQSLGSTFALWTATQSSSTQARGFYVNNSDSATYNTWGTYFQNSVRLVKDTQ